MAAPVVPPKRTVPATVARAAVRLFRALTENRDRIRVANEELDDLRKTPAPDGRRGS